MRRETFQDERIKVKRFPLMVFIPTLMVLVILTTVQYKFLGKYMDLSSMPRYYGGILICFWVVLAAAFTCFTRYQVIQRYDKPMGQLADAARKVAGGDFSVYVKAIHTADRADYLDVMIEDFNKMVAELGSIETLKTDFFSNVSHEIKTPLAVIQCYAEMLQNPGLSLERRDEYAQTILNASGRLSELIANILKLNKLEKHTIQPEPEPYDLCRQLCDCVLGFEKLWEEKKIRVEMDTEDRAMIVADPSLMELVWNNLISNAVKFTDPGGVVSVRQTSSEMGIAVSVSDTGCGMTEETMRHMFDKFYQGDTSRSTEGNGLGLALVLRILQIMGCEVNAESASGIGTAVTVFIPVNQVS